MSDTRQARRFFDAGVLAMGFTVDEHETTPDLQYAALAFQRATESDPTMGDAWLGRVAAGDTSSETIFSLYKNRASIFVEQRRLGLRPGALRGRFPTGMYVDYPLSNPTEAAAAYAAAMIKANDYQEAEEALDNPLNNSEFPIINFIRGYLHFKTQRWPDVLAALRGSDDWPDKFMGAAAGLMSGSSCGQLGLFDEAINRLSIVEEGPIPAAATAAMFTRGLCLREQGSEDKARPLFEKVYSQDPSFTSAAKALQSNKFRITVTSAEQIAARADKWDPESVSENSPTDTLIHPADEKLLDKARAELASQVGLQTVKTQVERLESTALVAKVRAEKGLTTQSRSLHLAFTGPPGTGKTTIARIIAKIYCGLGLLATDNVIEATRRDLVGEHLGATAIKTARVIDSALDGVLFIDEAYTLSQTGLSGGDAFGREAVDTLLARMENDRDRLVVIIAGYEREIDRFLGSNEGLASRFGRRIRFDSYQPNELVAIAELIAKKRDSTLSPDALAALTDVCGPLYEQYRVGNDGHQHRAIDIAGNGRFIRNVIETAEEEREYRLAKGDTDFGDLDVDSLMQINESDIRSALRAALSMQTASPGIH